MLRRLRFQLANRLQHPLLKLLVLDWRFSCLLLLLMPTIVFAVTLPVKIWKRSPPGFTPEVTISALDFIQASALSRSARTAEKQGDFAQALQAWSLALANDPCDRTIAANYIRALLRSKSSGDAQHALQIAGWLRGFSPDPTAHQLFIAAADRNEHWELVLAASHGALKPDDMFSEVHGSVLKALFRTGRFREAKDFLDRYPQSHSPASSRNLYSEALDCILAPTAEASDCVMLNANLQAGLRHTEAHEIYLITCAEKLDLPEFQETLGSLKEITSQTVALDVLHVRLLLALGRWREARHITSLLPAPRSALEAFEIASAFVSVGDREGALDFLRGFASEFQDSSTHLILYARLLLKEADRQELRALKGEIQKHHPSPILAVLAAGITCLLDPAQAHLNALTSAVNRLSPDPSGAKAWYFSAEALLQANRPDLACDVLTRIEPQHLQNSEFYFNLFAAAEANKDAVLMRRVAERSYQLAPGDVRAAANYGAMLSMCEEQPEEALALSAAFLTANPESTSARINHAAALINAERIGPADLVLRKIDESGLTSAALNQLRFIKLKRAVKLGNQGEIRRLTPLIDKSVLYSVQIRWLVENRI